MGVWPQFSKPGGYLKKRSFRQVPKRRNVSQSWKFNRQFYKIYEWKRKEKVNFLHISIHSSQLHGEFLKPRVTKKIKFSSFLS